MWAQEFNESGLIRGHISFFTAVMQITVSQHNLVQGYVDIEHGSNTIPCIQFHHESVDECMRKYILAPSKVRSKTKLMTVVEEINTLWTFIDLSIEEY